MNETDDAPGRPGSPPRWTSGRKTAVGTARSAVSHVWFTLERGILSEIYYPRIDQAAVRDLGLIVTDGDGWFSEEKVGTASELRWVEEGVPAYHLQNTCREGRYVIEKTVVSDPLRHVVFQRTRLTALGSAAQRLRLFVLLAPHLGDSGDDNEARVDEYDGIPMLFAERTGYGLALACSVRWLARSAGYVGVSDGWQQLCAHGRIRDEYERAREGNVALVGELDFTNAVDFTLALGFGRTTMEAGHRARLSLNQGIDAALALYAAEWRAFQASLRQLAATEAGNVDLYRVSTTVLGVHESKDFPGAIIAALAFPWGKLGRELDAGRDRGGYHVVWPRDTCEAAGALLAAGETTQAVRALDFLEATQLSDGSWSQNMWVDGARFWSGVQLDEAAAPLLLLDLARRHGALEQQALERLWPLMRRAAAFIARVGPLTPQDRWEDEAGLAPYTLGATIAALLVAADLADEHSEPSLAAFLRETADVWHDLIDDWLYAEGSSLARALEIPGFYVRFAPASRLTRRANAHEIANAAELVSVDALGLVRFGLRRADDPRILATVRVIDAVLRVGTPRGPCWRRYSHDSYGEHADGAPFDGTGIGRAWPLLVGERAHYELARGEVAEARRLSHVMEALAGPTRLLPEQVWDAEPVPERGLFSGEATNSARPLVWAHAEYVKLLRSLADGAVFDAPPQTTKRYLEGHARSRHVVWRFDRCISRFVRGRTLRIETLSPVRVHWSDDDWRSVHDTDSIDLGIGLFVTDLPTSELFAGRHVVFTCFWPEARNWEGRDFRVEVCGPP